MKLLINMISTVLACAYAGSLSAASVSRFPPVSNGFFDHMLVTWDGAYMQTPSREMHLTEGEVTAPNTSSSGVNEFFTVYTGVAPGYGTIVRLSPFGLGPNGITNATASILHIPQGGPNVSIAVTLTNIGSMPPVAERSYLPGGFIANLSHVGSFVVEGMQVWIRIRYLNNPQSPIVDLTWGAGSAPGDPGKVADDYERPRLETVGRPERTTLRFESRTNGMFVLVRAPDEGFTLEHTENIPDWVITPGPQSVVGFDYTYKFPVPGSADKMFFQIR